MEERTWSPGRYKLAAGASPLATLMHGLMHGRWRRGDRLTVAALADELGHEARALASALHLLDGKGLVAAQASDDYRVLAPLPVRVAGSEQRGDAIARIVHDWIESDLFHPEQTLGRSGLARTLDVDRWVIASGLAKLGGAGTIEFAGAGFRVPGARARAGIAAAVRSRLPSAPGALVPAQALAAELAADSRIIRRVLGGLWGEGVAYPRPSGRYCAGPPPAERDRLSAQHLAAVDRVSAWLDGQRTPGRPVSCTALARDFGLTKQLCWETLAYLAAKGRLDDHGEHYVVAGTRAVPPLARALGELLDARPDETRFLRRDLARELGCQRESLTIAAWWWYGAGRVVVPQGRYLVRAPSGRVAPAMGSVPELIGEVQ